MLNRAANGLARLAGFEVVAYLKIDTQGFDLEVLKSGNAVARQVPVVQTEVSLRTLYSGSPSMQDSVAAFGELGFTIADLFLISTDSGHRAVEFDCIMVRDARDATAQG